MGLEIYYKQDIERALLALAAAGAGRGPTYIEALAHVALAFGVRPPQLVKTWRVVGDDGQGEVLALSLSR